MTTQQFRPAVADATTDTSPSLAQAIAYAGDGGAVSFSAAIQSGRYALSEPLEITHSRQSWLAERTAVIAIGTDWSSAEDDALHSGQGVIRHIPADYDGTVDERLPYGCRLPSSTIFGANLADYGVEIGNSKHATLRDVEIRDVRQAYLRIDTLDPAVSPQDGLDLSFLTVDNVAGYGDVSKGIEIDVRGRSLDISRITGLNLVRKASGSVRPIGPAVDVVVDGTASGAQALKNTEISGYVGGFQDALRISASNGGLVLDNAVQLNVERFQIVLDGAAFPASAYDSYIFNFSADATSEIRGGHYRYRHGHLDRMSGIKTVGPVSGVTFVIDSCFGAWASKTVLVNMDADSHDNEIDLRGWKAGLAGSWLNNNSAVANYFALTINDAGKNIYKGENISSDCVPLNRNTDWATWFGDLPVGIRRWNALATYTAFRDTSIVWGGRKASLKLTPGQAVAYDRMIPADGRPKTASVMGYLATGGGSAYMQLIVQEIDPITGAIVQTSTGNRDASIAPGVFAPMVVSWSGQYPARVILANNSANPNNAYFSDLMICDGAWRMPPPAPYARRNSLPASAEDILSSNTAYRHPPTGAGNVGTTPTTVKTWGFGAGELDQQPSAISIGLRGNTSGLGNVTLSLVLTDADGNTATADIFANLAVSGTTSWSADVLITRDTLTTDRMTSFGFYGAGTTRISNAVAITGSPADLQWAKGLTIALKGVGTDGQSAILVTQGVVRVL